MSDEYYKKMLKDAEDRFDNLEIDAELRQQIKDILTKIKKNGNNGNDDGQGGAQPFM